VDHYSLVVSAAVSDDVTASVTVYVNVIDVNANSPEFGDVSGGSAMVASVSEDATVGSSVIAVSATDRDSGLLNVSLSSSRLSATYSADYPGARLEREVALSGYLRRRLAG